jgi:hypothetical protein
MKAQVLQGNDAPLNIQLRDAAGSPINPNSLTGLLVILYYKVGGQVLSKFSKNTLAGFEPITVVDGSAGLIQCKVQREVTANAQLGDVMIEIKMKASSSEWSNEDLEIGTNGILAFELTSSRLKNVTNY